MIVHSWNNGSPNKRTGAGYGIEISEIDREKYFDKKWGEIVLEFNDGTKTNINLPLNTSD